MQEQEPSKAPPNHARMPTGFALPANSTAEGRSHQMVMLHAKYIHLQVVKRILIHIQDIGIGWLHIHKFSLSLQEVGFGKLRCVLGKKQEPHLESNHSMNPMSNGVTPLHRSWGFLCQETKRTAATQRTAHPTSKYAVKPMLTTPFIAARMIELAW